MAEKKQRRVSAFTTAMREQQKPAEAPKSNNDASSSSENVEQLQSDTVTPSNLKTVELSNGETVKHLNSGTAQQRSSTTVKKDEKVSFYLTAVQANKLEDLAYEHRKRTGRRINRNDIVRHLIDLCDSTSLEGL